MKVYNMQTYYFKRSSMLLAAIILFLSNGTLPCTGTEGIATNLPKTAGASNWGKDFWFTVPPPNTIDGNSDSVKIFIAGIADGTVHIEVPGKSYHQSAQIVANEVICLSVPLTTACPWVKDSSRKAPEESVLQGMGIHIYSDVLLTVTVLVNVGNTSDSYLVLPVSSLGDKYYASSYRSSEKNGQYQTGMTAIVAAFDNTVVKFTLGGNAITRTNGGIKSGNNKSYTLAKGDVMIFASDGEGQDITGSNFTSNKPFAVVSGNTCAEIPEGNGPCGYIAEMDLPVFTWGLHFHLPQIPGRKHPSLIRVFTCQKTTTTISRNGTPIATMTSADGRQNKSWIEIRLIPKGQTPSSVLIDGDKPIAVTLYNTGGQEDSSDDVKTFPFSCVQVPDEQYQKEIMFTTPGLPADSVYKDNYLSLVYETDSNSLVPDDLEIARWENNTFKWEKVKTIYPGTDEIFPINADGKKYAVKNLKLPVNGTYKIRANTPLNAYAYGFNQTKSYSHPVSAGLKDLVRNDTVPPVPTLSFYNNEIINGEIKDFPDDGDVRSNLSLVYYHPDLSSNTVFNHTDFIPGYDRSTMWSVKPIDNDSNARAVITFADRCGNDTTIIMNFKAKRFSVDNSLLDFGTLRIGSEVHREFKIISTNKDSNQIISKIHFNKADTNYSFENLTLPIIFNPKDEKSISVKFKASELGEYVGSIWIADTNTYYNSVSIKAVVSEPIIYVTETNFGKVAKDSVKALNCTITNTGGVDLIITAVKGPDYPVFSMDSIPFPLTVNPGKNYSFAISFHPTEYMNYFDTIAFYSDAKSKYDNRSFLFGRGWDPLSDVNESTDRNLPAIIIPNPAGPDGAVARISSASECYATVKVYNSLGVEVLEAFSGSLANGRNDIPLQTVSLASGVYYLGVNTGGRVVMVRFNVIR